MFPQLTILRDVGYSRRSIRSIRDSFCLDQTMRIYEFGRVVQETNSESSTRRNRFKESTEKNYGTNGRLSLKFPRLKGTFSPLFLSLLRMLIMISRATTGKGTCRNLFIKLRNSGGRCWMPLATKRIIGDDTLLRESIRRASNLKPRGRLRFRRWRARGRESGWKEERERKRCSADSFDLFEDEEQCYPFLSFSPLSVGHRDGCLTVQVGTVKTDKDVVNRLDRSAKALPVSHNSGNLFLETLTYSFVVLFGAGGNQVDMPFWPSIVSLSFWHDSDFERRH